ncbi:hypothetical protein MRX96_005997 [Rhipicephalus microplus]
MPAGREHALFGVNYINRRAGTPAPGHQPIFYDVARQKKKHAASQRHETLCPPFPIIAAEESGEESVRGWNDDRRREAVPERMIRTVAKNYERSAQLSESCHLGERSLRTPAHSRLLAIPLNKQQRETTCGRQASVINSGPIWPLARSEWKGTAAFWYRQTAAGS